MEHTFVKMEANQIANKYFAEHPEEKDGVLKAWYAWLSPEWWHKRTMPLHNFPSSERNSCCVFCGRSREEVRYDELSPRCLSSPVGKILSKPEIKPIKETLREEEIGFNTLIEKGKQFIPKFIEKNKLNGRTLAILHHTHGYEPETVATVCGFEITPHMVDYEVAMNEERSRSRAKQKKEIIVAKTA